MKFERLSIEPTYIGSPPDKFSSFLCCFDEYNEKKKQKTKNKKQKTKQNKQTNKKKYRAKLRKQCYMVVILYLRSKWER